MVASVAGKALEVALRENEVGGTKEGRAWVIGQLIRLQRKFRQQGYDPGAFAEAIEYVMSLDIEPAKRP